MLGQSGERGWFLPLPLGILAVNLRDCPTISFDWRQDFQLGDIPPTQGKNPTFCWVSESLTTSRHQTK